MRLASRLSDRFAVKFTQRGSLASTGSPSNIYREIARIEHCLDGVPLFGRSKRGNRGSSPREGAGALVYRRMADCLSAGTAFDRPILVVVVALLEMALCVALTAGHGTNRQHTQTLALFEVRDQESCCSWLCAFHVQTAATSWRGC